MHFFKSLLLDFSVHNSPSGEWLPLKNCLGIQVPEYLYSLRCGEGCRQPCRGSGASRLQLILLLVPSRAVASSTARPGPRGSRTRRHYLLLMLLHSQRCTGSDFHVWKRICEAFPSLDQDEQVKICGEGGTTWKKKKIKNVLDNLEIFLPDS